MTVFPTEQLMTHEWQKHGTCSGSPALAYFKAAEDAHASVKLPPELEPGSERRSMTGAQIAKLIRDANPAITGRSLAVVCSGRKVASSCGTGPVQVPGAH